uniref:Uncharacterized protein n=1 Tax=Anguilla anguilla TaxID=7936 RepID=A0A0E9QQP6_ANGAN
MHARVFFFPVMQAPTIQSSEISWAISKTYFSQMNLGISSEYRNQNITTNRGGGHHYLVYCGRM